jgi:hypothetical protein
VSAVRRLVARLAAPLIAVLEELFERSGDDRLTPTPREADARATTDQEGTS